MGYAKEHGYRIAIFVTAFNKTPGTKPWWLNGGNTTQKAMREAIETYFQIETAIWQVYIAIITAKANRR